MNFDLRNGISMSENLTLDTKHDLSVKSIELLIFRGRGTLATPPRGRKVNFDPGNGISMSKNPTLDTQHDLSWRNVPICPISGGGWGGSPPLEKKF